MILKDYEVMIQNGVSTETVHRIHGNTVTCSLCEMERIENWDKPA